MDARTDVNIFVSFQRLKYTKSLLHKLKKDLIGLTIPMFTANSAAKTYDNMLKFIHFN